MLNNFIFKKTQKLLDRFLFIFFAEDRLLLPPNLIRSALKDWEYNKERGDYRPLYDRIKNYFHLLNVGFKSNVYEIFAYNGGLFAEDDILDSIKIDDTILYENCIIIGNYDFDTDVDVNILGHIFEHSLNEIDELQAELDGNTIDRVKTKRKKDGVFYTPRYITKYIVENTVGVLCDNKKNELNLIDSDFTSDKKKADKKKLLDQIETYREWLLKLTICDPACGSGAFLNQALDFLIFEHHKIDELIAKLHGVPIIFHDVEKSILENNLFGVDINEEAVDIARLSLWLRTAQKGRKLNNLSSNIKCGNSLIDDPTIAGEKAFNWQDEFPQVFANGGFDVVIGNPPYGASLNETEKIYIEGKYKTFEYQVNSYVIFYEKSINVLRDKGVLGFITPATFTYQHYFKKIRTLFQNYKQLSINKYCYEVFEDADIGDSVSWIISKTKNDFSEIKLQITNNKDDIFGKPILKEYKSIITNDFSYNLSNSSINIDKYSNSNYLNLDLISNIIVGIKPYQTGKGYPKQTPEDVILKKYTSTFKVDETYINCVIGKDFHKYKFINQPEMYLSYGKWLAEPRESAPFFENKIIIRQTSDSLICNIDFDKKINLNNVYNVSIIDNKFDIKFILSLLNSKLLNYLYQKISQEKGRLFAEVKKVNLAKLPIKILELKEQQIFINKVDLMILKNNEINEIKNKFIKLLTSKFPDIKINNKLEDWNNIDFKTFTKELEKQKIKLTLSEQSEWIDFFEKEKAKANAIQQIIAATDKEIDKMVYKLYELTEDEIKIVEGVS